MPDCVTNPPTEPGSYNVSIKGIMSCGPIFCDFDGEKWVGFKSYDKNDLKPGDAFWYEGTKAPLEGLRS